MTVRPPFRYDLREPLALVWTLVKWGGLGAWAGLVSGVASALFLHALAWATLFREQHPMLLWGLPLVGIPIALVYARYGKSVEGGNNLLLEQIHGPEPLLPFRMAPLILVSTVLTHLCGGSAGREGTAVQMGGALASLAQKPLRLSGADCRLLIQAGISGGFGSVFGTPLAGMVFGLEVLTVGRIDYAALIPCFIASEIGDLTTRALGIHHALYPAGALPPLTPWLWLLILAAGALFGGVGRLFSAATHAIGHAMRSKVKTAWLRPVYGGLAIVGLTYLVGTRDYLGLSLPLIARSFTPQGVFAGAFALKLLFTAITLGAGFKGGEVTPLFCIGATLGAAFARLTGEPTGLFAALGLAAVFAGAANTPLACILMGIELFGAPLAAPLAAVCIVSYILGGHRGIYLSQRIGTSKSHSINIAEGADLRQAQAGGQTVRFANPIFPDWLTHLLHHDDPRS